MSDLPESFDGLNAADHETHHLILHGMFNQLLDGGGTRIGDVLGKVSPGSTSAVVGNFQPHFVFDNQVGSVSHSTNGPLTIPVQRDTRGVVIDASANITAVQVVGMELLGNKAGWVKVRLNATNSITVNWSAPAGIITRGDVPTSMSPGDYEIFELQRWNV